MKIRIDPSGREWMIGLETDQGAYRRLGWLRGRVEAEVVQAVLQGALELNKWYESTATPDTYNREGIAVKGTIEDANIMVGGKKLLGLVIAKETTDLLEDVGERDE